MCRFQAVKDGPFSAFFPSLFRSAATSFRSCSSWALAVFVTCIFWCSFLLADDLMWVGSEKDEAGVSILDKVLQKLVKQIRNENLRRDKTSVEIVDAQSVQNVNTAKEKGYDAGKKYLESSAMS